MMRGTMLLVSFLLLLLRVPTLSTAAFVHNVNHHRHHHHSSSPSSYSSLLWSSFQQDGGGGGKWKVANDFHQFLNQCTIQTFLIVLHSIRDPQTIRWVDNFTAPIFYNGKQRKSARLTGTTKATTALTGDGEKLANPNGEALKLLKYHGLGVMNTTVFPTWDSYFAMLLQQPVQTLLVQSYNGLSKEYEMDINPASLCTRMVSIREQIAQEFANDLGVIANMGHHTMDSYYKFMERQRKEENNNDNAAVWSRNTNNQGEKDEVTMSSGADGSPRILPPHNLVFLDYALDPLDGHTPSPLRKGNFDLLVLLATQESIVRILNNNNHYQREDLTSTIGVTTNSKFQTYLRDFYAQRMDSHFSGIQRYGRADDFLEDLLFFSSPRVMSSSTSITGGEEEEEEGSSTSFPALVDPVQLTEILLNERRQVALEWQAMSKDVPNDHISIRRLQLDRLMQSYS